MKWWAAILTYAPSAYLDAINSFAGGGGAL